MNIFRAFLVVAWIAIGVLTVQALAAQGIDGGMVFFSDFAHPWRAQINADFGIHGLLLIIWIVWREASKPVGLLCALGAMMGGSAFSLLYILAATFRARGNVKTLLLGAHTETAA